MQKYISLKGRICFPCLIKLNTSLKLKKISTSIYFNLHVHIKDYKSCKI